VVLYCSGIVAKYSRCTCIGVPKSVALSSLHVCANIFPAVSSDVLQNACVCPFPKRPNGLPWVFKHDCQGQDDSAVAAFYVALVIGHLPYFVRGDFFGHLPGGPARTNVVRRQDSPVTNTP